jgi:DNA-binding Lrp family transcriptional regulator
MTTPRDRSETETSRKPDNVCARDLDVLDARILRVLQDHADLSNVKLSNRVGLTPAPCLRRVRKLERSGHIRGYHAKLDAKMLGFDVVGFVFVSLHSQAHDDFIAFEKQVIYWPIVRECYALHGETDFVLKCVARNLAHFQRFITEALLKLPNIKSIKSAPAVRISKEDPVCP